MTIDAPARTRNPNTGPARHFPPVLIDLFGFAIVKLPFDDPVEVDFGRRIRCARPCFQRHSVLLRQIQ
jgi:hypothetical protein